MKNLFTSSLALILSIASLNAAISLNIEQVGADSVFTYNGSLSDFTFDSSNTQTIGYILSGGFGSRSGDYDRADATWIKDSGDWTSTTTTTGTPSGDAFAFGSTFTDAPDGYTAGDNISGSVTFANLDLVTDMGFTLGDAGTWSSLGGNTLNYTVVPEPAAFAAIGGILALGLAAYRRRAQI